MQKTKKLTAILLAIVMLAGTFTVCFCGYAAPAVAAPVQATASSSEYPLVILPGINHSVSYVANEDGTPAVNAEGNELSGGLLIIDTADLVNKLVKKLLWPVLSSLFLQRDNGLSTAAYETVCDLFSIQSCDKQGNQTHNLKTMSYDYPVSQMDDNTKGWFYRMLPMQSVAANIGEENIYLYTFPLVGDPMESASGLVDYIEMVKRQRNVDKVNLATVSLGGTILTAYADIINNDWSNVNSIINVVALLNGTDLMGDFYARKWNLSDEFLYKQYVKNIFTEMNGSPTLGCVVNLALRLFSRRTVEGLLTGAFSGILDTMLINNPEFWAMIPKERYESIADKYLVGEDYAVLRAKTDAFQQARVNLERNLLAASSSGVAINNLCGYNLQYTDGEYSFFGIVASSASSNGDAIIPAYSGSLGAYTVPARTSFSEEYLATAQSNGTASYISPDKSLDASTCLFPDNVWFFNGQHHETGYDDVVFSLLNEIIAGRVTDVNSSDRFPQFNGFRKTKNLTRYLFIEAETVMANAEGSYTAEQVAAVTEAYNEAKALLANTVMATDEQNKVDAVSLKLENALIYAGIHAAGEEPGAMDDVIEKIAVAGDDVIFKVFGGGGFSDFRPTAMLSRFGIMR